jgi:hypothetical protein
MLRRVVGLIEGLLEICGRMFVSICRMMGRAGWEGGREGGRFVRRVCRVVERIIRVEEWMECRRKGWRVELRLQ